MSTTRDRALLRINSVKQCDTHYQDAGASADHKSFLRSVLADLLHWADHHGINFDIEEREARDIFHEERLEDGQSTSGQRMAREIKKRQTNEQKRRYKMQ